MSDAADPSRLLRAAVSLALVAGVAVAYAPAGGFDFISFDDPQYVTANPAVRGGLSWRGVAWALTQPHAHLWHPLTSLSHMLDVSLFGLDAGPPHLVNVALHAASAWACFAVLLAMTGRPGPSALAAMLFAWHPARVESVAWIAERKDVLSMLLAWTTLGAWVAHVRRPSPWRFALALACFAASVSAKSMMVTLPLVMLLLDGWPLARLRLGWRRLVAEKAPFLVIAAVCALVTYHVQAAGGAVAAGDLLSPGTRLANAAVAYVRHLGLLAWPADLAIFYPYRTWPPVVVALAAGALVAISAGALAVRGRAPYVTMGWLWYVVTLFPVSGIVQAGSQSMADRFTYLPSVGIAVALAWTLADHGPTARLPRSASLALVSIVGLLLLVTTRRQVETWRDSEAVFRHAIAVTGDNYLAQNHLGEALSVTGRPDEAEPHYAESVRLNARYAPPRSHLGNAFARRGQVAEAEAHYRAAIALDPDLAEAHNGLGTLLATRGDLPGAVGEFRAALAAWPRYPEALANLGSTLRRQGDFTAAADAYRAALTLQPAWIDVRVGLAQAQAALGHLEDAERILREVLDRHPEFTPARELLQQLDTNDSSTGREAVRGQRRR